MARTAAPNVHWNIYGSRPDLATALADQVAAALRGAIERRGSGFIAVSGGTTPGLFFQKLSNEDLDWRKVTVTLADERYVERASPRANAGLVKAKLLQNKATEARFADLYRPAADLDTAAAIAEGELRALPWPLDIAALGMGTDGHTASFFPGAADLETLLDPSAPRILLPTHATDGEPRLTLTLSRLMEAQLMVVQIEGQEKRKVLEDALAGNAELPIRRALDCAKNPVQVFWAP